MSRPPERDRSTIDQLLAIVERYRTPTYAFDLRRLRLQADKLRKVLPPEVDVLYSLKANASLGICDVMAQCGLGADVASAGELATARAAGFQPRDIFVAGPFKLAETVDQLRALPEAVVSVDSLSELQALSEAGLTNPAVLRLRPDFGSCAVVAAGSECRFGFTEEQLRRCADYLPVCPMSVIGCHVFAGSQVLSANSLNDHLRRACELSLRACDQLGIWPKLLNLGGGFGIPYGPADRELDLAAVAAQLAELARRVAPGRIVLELGRYLVAQAGWYLTTVLGHQTYQGRRAVVVDGGTHQRADMCGLCLRSQAFPPVALDAPAAAHHPTDVLGCLSLPADVMSQNSLLPQLAPGNVLAYRDAGAYGIWSSPALFHGSPLPAEVAFDESTIQLMRPRKPAHSILEDQQHVELGAERNAAPVTVPPGSDHLR